MSLIINPFAFGGVAPSSALDPALKGAAMVLSNSDRTVTKAGSGYQTVYGLQGRNSGRYAFEVVATSITSDGSLVIGVADKTNPTSVTASFIGNNSGAAETIGHNDFLGGRFYRRMTVGNTNGTSTGPDFVTGSVVTIDVDMGANLFRAYVNGTLLSIGAVAITSGKTYFPAISVQTGGIATFRGTGLAYLPSGATAWG